MVAYYTEYVLYSGIVQDEKIVWLNSVLHVQETSGAVPVLPILVLVLLVVVVLLINSSTGTVVLLLHELLLLTGTVANTI